MTEHIFKSLLLALAAALAPGCLGYGFPSSGGQSETSTTTEASPTTASGSGSCGDGTVDGGEECDSGPLGSTECDPDCTMPTCGDGYVNAYAGELCDDGEQNSEAWSMDEHCRPDCSSWAPYCGDGSCDAEENPVTCNADCTAPHACGNETLEEGEECDDGNVDNADACLDTCKLATCGDGFVQAEVEECDDGNDDNADDCSRSCELPRHAFVTSDDTFKGNLGGLTGADTKCRALATAAGLPNSTLYRAWLSDGVDSPETRFKAAQPATLFQGKYVLVDGVTAIALNGWEDLTDGSLDHAIDMDENGSGGVQSNPWTNTAADGTNLGVNHCDGWTSMSALPKVGAFGNAGSTDVSWTNLARGNQSCSAGTTLYCFEDR